MQNFYAIRHIPTGRYLPANGKRNRGYTHDDPADLLESPPRLFVSIRAAKNALNWWLKGETHVQTTKSGFSSLSGEWEDPVETWKTQKREDRKIEEMEIVKIDFFVSSIPTKEALEYGSLDYS